MIVLNLGVPRSGTVLVNAIVRELFLHRKLQLHQTNPHEGELTSLVRGLFKSGADKYRTTLVHGHVMDAESLDMLRRSPQVTGFTNYRDPRDVVVSLMRLHEINFDAAVTVVSKAFVHMERSAIGLELMVLPYELLVKEKRAHIFQIARLLGFWPTLQEVEKIDAATTIDKHRAVMEDVRERRIEGLVEHRNPSRTMAEDPRTLINDRHIQSGETGRWRTTLKPEQAQLATEKFRMILKAYGYDEV